MAALIEIMLLFLRIKLTAQAVTKERAMIKIPKFFHEILGEFQSKANLFIISFFVIISGLFIGTLGYEDLNGLPLLNQVIVWFLFLDISGGVVANLTAGTDIFYERHPKKRWIFIAIHIQPIILSWSIGFSSRYGLIVCIYTLTSAIFLNLIREHKLHIIMAGCLTALGLLIVIYISLSIPFFASSLLIFYVFKVLFSFSVFYNRGEQNEY